MFKKFLASCVVVGLMVSPVLANQNATKKAPVKTEKKAPVKKASSVKAPTKAAAKAAKPKVEGC
ncbi:MAG: hypothetical protein AB7E28_08805 [Desulfurella sp.]|jgi:hypothetical protein